MLRKIEPDAKLLSDLSEVTRTNTAVAKYTADDRGDLKFYKNGDASRSFVRVCETFPPLDDKKGPAKYRFVMYEIFPALGGGDASPAPTILEVK